MPPARVPCAAGRLSSDTATSNSSFVGGADILRVTDCGAILRYLNCHCVCDSLRLGSALLLFYTLADDGT